MPRQLVVRRAPAVVGLSIAAMMTAPAAAAQDTLAIRGANVIDLERGRVLANQTLLIADGRIVALGPAASLRRRGANRELDARGRFVMPGLLDMHVHLRANGVPSWLITDWMMPLMLTQGVTGARDMNSDCDNAKSGPVCAEQILQWRTEIDQGTRVGPRILAASSFMVNPPFSYTMPEAQARGFVDLMAQKGLQGIKIYDRLAPDALPWFVDQARQRHLDVWGHVPVRMTARAAAEAGMRSIEHARDFVFDCFPGTAEFRRTTQGTMPSMELLRAMIDQHDARICQQTFAAMVAHGTWYVPTHVTRRRDAMMTDSAFVNDPRLSMLPPFLLADWKKHAERTIRLDSAAGGRTLRDFHRLGLTLTGQAYRAGVHVLVGTDGADPYSIPGYAMHDEMAELASAGLTTAQVLRAATLDAARFLRLEQQYGTVAVGKRADLLLLGANPLTRIGNTRTIQAVVLGGRPFERAALDSMLTAARAAAQLPMPTAPGRN